MPPNTVFTMSVSDGSWPTLALNKGMETSFRSRIAAISQARDRCSCASGLLTILGGQLQLKYLELQFVFGCGRRSRTFIFGFKARRVAGYTILQQEVSGHWDSNPEPRADLALTPLIRRLLCH